MRDKRVTRPKTWMRATEGATQARRPGTFGTARQIFTEDPGPKDQVQLAFKIEEKPGNRFLCRRMRA